MTTHSQIDTDAVRDELSRILSSPGFVASPRISDALRYVVIEALEGRADRIKAYSIAVDVLEKPAEFDPSSDPIVRVLIGRLRNALATFYNAQSETDRAMEITIPKGSYVPVFIDSAHNSRSLTGMGKKEVPRILPFSRTIIIRKFDVFSLELVSETSPDRSNLISSGLQVELIDKLSKFKDITVLEADNADSGQQQETPDRTAGKYSLTGKIRLSRGRIIVSAVMHRTDDKATVWSKTYDEKFENTDELFDIQTDIAADIAGTIGQPYGTIGTRIAAARSRSSKMDLDHYFALVDFYQFSNDRSEKKFADVLKGLEKATAALPEFSSAWAALSWMYNYERFSVNDTIDPRIAGAKALDAAYKAVNADPQNAMAYQYMAIAKYDNGDFEGFRSAARTSLKLNPNDAEVLADMGSHFILLDNSEEGKRMVERAMLMNPGHPLWYHFAITVYYYTRGLSDEAIYHARQFAQEGSLMANILLAACLAQGKRIVDAKEVYKSLLADRPVFATDYQRILADWHLPSGMKPLLMKDLVTAGLQKTSQQKGIL